LRAFDALADVVDVDADALRIEAESALPRRAGLAALVVGL
jgi:hypothetical protein